MVNGAKDRICLVTLINFDVSTLLILAGGLGSRYRGGKQTSAVGPNGEYIMEYAIYDAVNNGFDTIIVLSSTALIPGLKQKFAYLYGYVSLHFVDQYEHDLNYPNYRKKPWGTAHAVWACRKEIKGQFLVLNADDFYGDETFKIARNIFKESKAPQFGLITFFLKNTLPSSGGVSRGLCETDQNRLVSVVEHTNIISFQNKITSNESIASLDQDAQVSMNCWVLHSNIFFDLGSYFKQFHSKFSKDARVECGLPSFIQSQIQNGQQYEVYRNESKWFGLTHPYDFEWCKQELKRRVEEGRYPKILLNNYE